MTQNEYIDKLTKLANLYLTICGDLDKRAFKCLEDAYAWWDHQGKGSKMAGVFGKAYAKFQVVFDLATHVDPKSIEELLVTNKQPEWLGANILDWIKTYVPRWQIDEPFKRGYAYTCIDYAWELIKKFLKWKKN